MAGLTSKDLASRMVHRRAVQAVLWGMPAVNYDLMLQAMIRETGGVANQIVYWSRLPDWKNQTLTPNPDAIYIMPFIDTGDGPVVLEIPAANGGSITGSIDDAWQTAIEDVGPAGVDKGAGGKYLLLPPGWSGTVPDGYLAMPAQTFQSYALLRSILKSGSDADVAAAVAYAKGIKLYPLAAADAPAETVWRDAIDCVFDATIPYDIRFFQSLDRMVQREPWIDRDRVMIDVLASIGIEKGKAFAPDAETTAILEDAAREAHAYQQLHYDDVFAHPFDERARWTMPASATLIETLQSAFANPDSYPIDARGLAYSYAFFSAKHLGAGQYYLMTIQDADGDILDGGRTYSLKVPPDAPVRQYWSATIYDRETHAFIRGMDRVGRSSQSPDLKQGDDGSIEVIFGPNAPPGAESNWVPTDPAGKFEILFRLYGPEPAFFEKKWLLPDVEKAVGA